MDITENAECIDLEVIRKLEYITEKVDAHFRFSFTVENARMHHSGFVALTAWVLSI